MRYTENDELGVALKIDTTAFTMATGNVCDEELISFLHDKSERSSFKSSALFVVLGLTASKEGVEHIVKNTEYLLSLCLIASERDNHSSYAHNSLINISAHECGAVALTSMKNISFFQWIIDGMLETEVLYPTLKCHILANVARFIVTSTKLVEYFHSYRDKFLQLLEIFCSSDQKIQNDFESLASVMCNLTQTPGGRKLLLDKERALIEKLLPYTTFMGSIVRRTGVIRALRNCCFDIDYHDWLLEEIDILPTLLLPLAGPEELDDDDMEKLPVELQYLGADKKREPNPLLRKMLIEAITKLCATKDGRIVIKNSGAYYVLSELHKSEKDPSVIEACENLVNILIGDEPEPELENLMEIEIPPEIEKQFEKCKEIDLEEHVI